MSAPLDAPNQQVVRPDGSGPGDEGEGGSTAAEPTSGLDSMTKAELLDVAAERGVEVDPASTKADIRAALE